MDIKIARPVLGLLAAAAFFIPAFPAISHAQPSCVAEALRAAVSKRAAYASEGYFVEASAEGHRALGAAYREAGIIKKISGNIKRVGEKDLGLDLNRVTPAELNALVRQGRGEISKLHYFTSGAGLWSRGGGQVKALIPFNLKAVLLEDEFLRLARAGDFFGASDSQDILRLAGRNLQPGEDLEKVAALVMAEKQAEVTQLIAKASAHSDALNPVDLKLVNVALQSERSGAYVSFDIWTSEQTHEPIRKYLAEFATGYRNKRFHQDPALDAKVKQAVGRYLEESRNLGETHLFGYQVGYRALDLSGNPVSGTPMIGEGAGMAKAYLEESGRAAQLRAMGKTSWVFENIEVVTDLPVAMAAYVRSGKPVGVILVPEKQGYKGGSPFLVERGGDMRLELHEMSALPKEFAEGNSYFNSNTIFQSLDLPPPKSLGFEQKKQGSMKIIRVKMNAGDITLDAPTAGIGGRIGVEYENFKNYAEFGQNGEKLIGTFQEIWMRDLSAH